MDKNGEKNLASKHTNKQPIHCVQIHSREPEARRRNPLALSPAVQKGRSDAYPRPRAAAARVLLHQRDERGCAPLGDAADEGL